MDLDALLRFLLPYVDQGFDGPPYDASVGSILFEQAGRSAQLHERLLTGRNGFYAFNGLLHVLGACIEPPNHSLFRWNAPDGWRASWGYMCEGMSFFAQTAFGDQFAYRGGKIVRLRVLEGAVIASHASLEEWLQSVILDPEFTLDKRLFDACVQLHGALPYGGHFAPLPSYDYSLPLEAESVHVVPTRDSLETAARMVREGLVRRRSSVFPRP
ncbi:MAG: hypothetical protein Q8Q09_25545 [Deltaproteobacteria bacterium]|nr:hypothetical protein [Deltaproteobacteria bacterium]